MAFASVDDLAAFLQRDLDDVDDAAELALTLATAAIQAEEGAPTTSPSRPVRWPAVRRTSRATTDESALAA